MSFQFESILKLNKNKEDLLQRDMGKINTMIQKQKDSQNFMQEVTENKKEELNQKKRQNIDVDTMILYDNFFRGSSKKIIIKNHCIDINVLSFFLI